MRMQAKPEAGQNAGAAPLAAAGREEISAAALMAALESHASKALIFVYDGREVLPGYHVTEVKAGRFSSLDCGANPEFWNETIIQLWDVPPEAGRGLMPVWKFLAIMRKVADSIALDTDAKLTFEVSDPESAMKLYRAAAVTVDGDTVRVTLDRRPASCKPRDRWLEAQPQSPAACCGPSERLRECCN